MWIKVSLWHWQVVMWVLLTGTTAVAQQSTIPERLADKGVSLVSGMTIPSGPTPTLETILDDTDTVVRGIVGTPSTTLSADQRHVQTDYPIRSAIVLHTAHLLDGDRPGALPAVTVRVLGGTVEINGLTFTETVEAMPSLEPGVECLFLLKREGNHYRLAGRFYGAFRILNDTLRPLVKKHGFASEQSGASATQTIAQMVARLQKRPL